MEDEGIEIESTYEDEDIEAHVAAEVSERQGPRVEGAVAVKASEEVSFGMTTESSKSTGTNAMAGLKIDF